MPLRRSTIVRVVLVRGLRHSRMQSENFWTRPTGNHGSKKRVSAGIINRDRQNLTGQTPIPVEYHDPIARSSAGHLRDLARIFVRGLAGSLDQYLDLLADETLVILFADRVLHGQ
jgi:hypothetical protein